MSPAAHADILSRSDVIRRDAACGLRHHSQTVISSGVRVPGAIRKRYVAGEHRLGDVRHAFVPKDADFRGATTSEAIMLNIGARGRHQSALSRFGRPNGRRIERASGTNFEAASNARHSVGGQ